LAEGVATPKRRRVGLVNRAAEEVGGILFIFFLKCSSHMLYFIEIRIRFKCLDQKRRKRRNENKANNASNEKKGHFTGTHRGPNCNSTLVSPHCRVPLKSPLKQEEQEEQEQHQ